MNVNLTLVVQALHFGIAYYFINRFFLEPLVAIIQHDNAQASQMDQAIRQAQNLLQNRQNYKKECWYDSQQIFTTIIPLVKNHYSLVIDQSPVDVQIDKEYSRDDIQTMKNDIMQRLKHV